MIVRGAGPLVELARFLQYLSQFSRLSLSVTVLKLHVCVCQQVFLHLWQS